VLSIKDAILPQIANLPVVVTPTIQTKTWLAFLIFPVASRIFIIEAADVGENRLKTNLLSCKRALLRIGGWFP
jgi:hypothetical protein